MIKIIANGRQLECTTTEEAIAILNHLDAIGRKSPLAVLVEMFGVSETSHWTRESFWKFIENVGEQQQSILSLLVQKRKASAEEMRKILNVDSNQKLAGILSGISKRAGAQNIPARAVYTIENESKNGEMTKTYVAAMDFLRIATEMNWPG
jgi:hypothetical protein